MSFPALTVHGKLAVRAGYTASISIVGRATADTTYANDDKPVNTYSNG